MLKGWAQDATIKKISVIDPHADTTPFSAFPHVTFYKNTTEVTHPINTLILAIKPQIMADICAPLKSHISTNTLIVSIAAGKTIESFAKIFGTTQPIIRTMPNTPAAIGKGITAICANAHVNAHQHRYAKTLLKVTGQVITLEDESHFNAITALSGSGPAYVFHMIEMLEKAGTEMGLPSDLSQKLARQTVIGSAALAESENTTPAATLRQNVTSPGGTTAAALEILMDGTAQNIYTKALKAAKNRGKDLNENSNNA